MAEESKKTAKEIKADVDLKKAQIEREMAETKKVQAETRKAESEALISELDAQKKYKEREKELSIDEEHHLYRFDGEVSKASVSRCMAKLTQWSRLDPKCNIEIIFASPGGEIISGFELFDFIQSLRNKGHHITTGSLGYAASMAGILLMAGDTRWIGHQSWMMIHRAAFGAYGKTFEIEDEVRFVRRIEERIVDIFTKRSKLSKQKVKRNWDRKDWWISADECVEMGLVDEIRGMMREYEEKEK